MKVSLSVPKLMPGTFFNQTRKPLQIYQKVRVQYYKDLVDLEYKGHCKKSFKRKYTRNSILHRHKGQCKDKLKVMSPGQASQTSQDLIFHQNCTTVESYINRRKR